MARQASALQAALHADQRIPAHLVERFFAEITSKRIRRGTFTSVAEPKQAMHEYLDRHNADPKPFVWAKTADVILAKERRVLDLLEAVKAGTKRKLGTLG